MRGIHTSMQLTATIQIFKSGKNWYARRRHDRVEIGAATSRDDLIDLLIETGYSDVEGLQ